MSRYSKGLENEGSHGAKMRQTTNKVVKNANTAIINNASIFHLEAIIIPVMFLSSLGSEQPRATVELRRRLMVERRNYSQVSCSRAQAPRSRPGFEPTFRSVV